MITRFVVLPDERGLILGVDKAGVFEKGVVYEAVDYGVGDPVITAVGPSSIRKYGEEGDGMSVGNDVNHIVYGGTHLLTVEELKNMSNDDSSR